MDQTPDWSPDGTRSAYAAEGDVWLMDADGADVVDLTPGEGDGSDRRVVAPTPGLRQTVPAWQPLGRR